MRSRIPSRFRFPEEDLMVRIRRLYRFATWSGVFAMQSLAWSADGTPSDFTGRWEIAMSYAANPHTRPTSRLVIESHNAGYTGTVAGMQFEGKRSGSSLQLRC